MIGVVCSALAALSASAVARRQRRHRPIAVALLVALAYAGSVESGSSACAPRLTLVLWALAAVVASWAYLDAWGRSGAWWPALAIGGMVAGALIFGGRERWLLATWGPVGVSAVCGIVGAVQAQLSPSWRSRRIVENLSRATVAGLDGRNAPPFEWLTITQRIALVLTASDVACLLFVPWPGVQSWQGRVSAIVVAGMQVVWYLNDRRR